MHASDQQCGGLSAHLPWRSAIVKCDQVIVLFGEGWPALDAPPLLAERDYYPCDVHTVGVKPELQPDRDVGCGAQRAGRPRWAAGRAGAGPAAPEHLRPPQAPAGSAAC